MSDQKPTATDEKLDDMLDDTFPASDPPSTTPAQGTRKSREIAAAHEEGHAPDASPSDDRLKSETAPSRSDEA